MSAPRALAAGVALSALGLVGCKGDAKLTTSTVSPDGTKVITPRVSGDASGATTSAARGRPAPAAPTLLATTGTTSRRAPADADFAFPKPGIYSFHDTITPDDGGRGVDHDTYFTLSTVTDTLVRVQETNAAGSPKSSAFYEERHDDDGLWLVASATDSGVCRWEPRSALLPQRVRAGGTSVTNAMCTAGDTTFRLETKVSFKVVRDVTIGGRALRCIDVTRHRVLTDGKATITTDAVDTYAFELGMRVATSEHTSTETADGRTGFTRNLVLVSLPS